jgi:D-alanyl-D-alanine carboxypeptidase
MLPFTKMMKVFPMMNPLSEDQRTDRFVSKEFSLSLTSYAPDDLELLTGSSIDTAGRTIYLRKEALTKIKLLAKAFEKEFKRPLVIVSGYRSANYQQRLWDLGRCTDTLCAPPGYSEHQLGLAIDIFEATTEKDYLANRAFARYLNWFQENAHLYGYHQSYQKWEKIDAYEVEPWHWRYLGEEIASELKNLNMTYTEYIEFRSMRSFWGLY